MPLLHEKTKPMRVLIINTSERTGGAAIAAGRLNESLNNNGIKSMMLVRDKETNRIDVAQILQKRLSFGYFLWERLVIWIANRFSRNNLFVVDIANTGNEITDLPEFKQADIIHLHWINQGMLSLKQIGKILESGKPVVWTMHDMWPCTGICHHARECNKYTQQCHNCQYLRNQGSRHDLSWKVFRKKMQTYQKGTIQFVTCSNWLKSKAEQSRLLQGHPVYSIPNPINTNLFRPSDKTEARKRMNLPLNRKILLFGSLKVTDKRKGIDYLVEACQLLAKQHEELKEQLGVAVFGKASTQITEMLPFQVYPLNYIRDERELVNLYNAIDLYVTPSLEENLPNTIMEAMACGIPCVGFQVGGIPEMIDHLHNGYVAEYQSAEDFANGIYWTLNESEYPSLSEQARRKVLSCYSENNIAKKYTDIYNKIVSNHA